MEDLVRRAAHELVQSRYAIVLTGAGMSTESGLSDYFIQGKTGDVLPWIAAEMRGALKQQT